ncbi:MAG: hypothetical protein EHM43_02350, partial [Ignavibacteriae bacterium]
MIVDQGGVLFGVDKIANTFVFTGNADITAPSDDLAIRFTNQYRGTAFRTVTTAVRDDQSAQLSLTVPTIRGLATIVRSAWVLSQDSRSLGLSSLNRISGAVGIAGDPTPWWKYEALGGIESTTQLGIQATGPLAGVRTFVSSLPLDLWSLNGTMLADWHYLDARRTNADLDLRADLRRDLNDGSYLRVGGAFGSLVRQYFTALVVGSAPEDVESRNEDRMSFDADVLYIALPNLTFGLTGFVMANAIERSYDDAVVGVPLTAVARTSDESIFDLDGRVTVSGPKLSATIGAGLYRRTEANIADSIHVIASDDLASLRSQEFQRDNQTDRTRWYLRGWWTPSSVDTVSADWTWFLLRYDTPSSFNDDDRDELNAIATIRYSRRLSELLTAGLAISGQFTHFVFLKASRSALNNQINAIRLAPFVRITGRVVNMRPQFEILANYTVYDFEGEGASVRSYGFRQLSYRDSIEIRLTNYLRLEAPVLIRYFERSTLLWNNFS